MIIMVSVIQDKSWDLSFLMDMLTEAQEMNDDMQVKKIAKRGIEEAERQGETQWKAKFQEILDELSQGTSFDTFEEEESEPASIEAFQGSPDLSQVKGIGTSVDVKLRSNGFTTIEMLASSTPELLSRVPGIGVASAQKIIENARAFLGISFDDTPREEIALVEPGSNPTNEMTPYQKLLARAKEKSESQKSSPKVENRIVNEKKSELKLTDWIKEPESTKVLTSLRKKSSIPIDVEDLEEHEEEFEEEFEDETEYKPISSSLFSTREKLVKEEDSEFFKEPEPEEVPAPRELETIPEIKPRPVRIQVPEVPKKTSFSKPKPPKVSYREARMNSLPNGKQLLQRQQSAQKILRVIREAGMVEIPMNKPELQSIFQAVDLLACKPMRGENGRCIILLVPIKHLSTVEPVYVWDSHVMTGTLDDEPTTSANMAINTHVKKLVSASEYLFSEITRGKSLIPLVSRFIGISVKADVTFRNKRLYVGSKEIEFQLILDPILLTDTEVYCLEKTLPYAYQQGSNLHVISYRQLDEMLEFLQLKYRLLNRHDTSQNAIMKTDGVKTATYKQLQLFSLPFLAYGLLFAFLLLLGIQEAIRFCISLGYGLMIVYSGLIGFLVVRHFKSMKCIETDFSIPYHQRDISLSQEDFILINEQLSPDWMVQFSHEIEIPQKQIKEKRARTTFAGDNTSIPQSNNQYSINAKYRAFLDD